MALGVIIVVLVGVLSWACIGLINPKWARFPNRAFSVGVLVVVGSILVPLLIVLVMVYYFGMFVMGP